MVSTCPKSFLEIELLCPLSGQYINHIRKEYHTRTHTRQELDHCSDPSGTESCNMQNSLNKHWLQNNEKDSLFNSSNWILQVQGGDQPPLPTNGNSFVACSMPKVLHAPALLKGEDRRKKKREVLHLFRCYTHTHTLAQNCHCEFCCGMHLPCKNTPVTPDRSRRVFGVEWKENSFVATLKNGIKSIEARKNSEI